MIRCRRCLSFSVWTELVFVTVFPLQTPVCYFVDCMTFCSMNLLFYKLESKNTHICFSFIINQTVNILLSIIVSSSCF